MKFWIDLPFTFTDADGQARFTDVDFDRVFDTKDVGWNLPQGWTPPLVGVRPMDAEAQAALRDARLRSGKVGQQLPGIGILQADEPIFVP